ncbi:XdhC family protein [Streptomyces sp. NPDC003720]|uniref:XdhC family protein n=1 Tax=Streptomyces sp. NPDC003720 TaxID=3364684 RepID=UPI0036A46B1D
MSTVLDLRDQLLRWHEEGRAFAVATMVAVHGSAPRSPGSALAVGVDRAVIGSASGSCVEGAVYDLCQEALASGACTVESFGY